MMNRLVGIRLLAVLVLVVSGCGVVGDLLRGTRVTVDLVNETDFEVQATLFFDDEQNIPEFLLVQSDIGTEVSLTVPPGQTISFSESCDDLQALIVENANLALFGSLGPDANTDVLRDGDDFGCGDTVVLRFTDSNGIADFDIVVERE